MLEEPASDETEEDDEEKNEERLGAGHGRYCNEYGKPEQMKRAIQDRGIPSRRATRHPPPLPLDSARDRLRERERRVPMYRRCFYTPSLRITRILVIISAEMLTVRSGTEIGAMAIEEERIV